jgi:hypothetical protein
VTDGLIEKLRANTGPSNALDMEIDIALFKPDAMHVAVRANEAGTKLVYTRHDGRTDTYWANDHTLDDVSRELAIEQLRALSHTGRAGGRRLMHHSPQKVSVRFQHPLYRGADGGRGQW